MNSSTNMAIDPEKERIINNMLKDIPESKKVALRLSNDELEINIDKTSKQFRIEDNIIPLYLEKKRFQGINF